MARPNAALSAPRAQYSLPTERGVIGFYVPASSAFIERLSLDPGIGAFWQYKDIERQKDLLLETIACGGQVALAAAGDTLIGYLILCPPGPLERWAAVPGLFDATIEVSRRWRRLCVADRLLELTFAARRWERCIALVQGYHGHWDADFNNLSVWSYRNLIRRLFEAHGFTVYDTDDPEIADEMGNILLARIGRDCPPARRRAFYQTLFLKRERPRWLEELLAG